MQKIRILKPNLTLKLLERMHLDKKHGSFLDMASECKRLEGKKLLYCKHVHKDKNLQARLGELVFVQNNTVWKRLEFTPHQMVLGLS